MKLLDKSYLKIREPRVISTQGLGGSGSKHVWMGWLSFSSDGFMRVFTDADSRDIEELYTTFVPGQLIDIAMVQWKMQ